MTNIRDMSYQQLLRSLKVKNCERKWNVLNRLIVVCEDYNQAKKAYLYTTKPKYYPEPCYGLLELMLSYANREQLLEILEIIENDEDEMEYFTARVMDKYDSFCINIIDEHPFGIHRYNYGITKLGKLYKSAPEGSSATKDVYWTLVKACKTLIGHPEDITKSRLEAIVVLDIDKPEFQKIQKHAKILLDKKQ